jgi:hypothetical protein
VASFSDLPQFRLKIAGQTQMSLAVTLQGKTNLQFSTKGQLRAACRAHY